MSRTRAADPGLRAALGLSAPAPGRPAWRCGRHHGNCRELGGAGLLALFGALEPNLWQARNTVLASLEMRRALANYDTVLRAKRPPELRFGVGIHCGEVVAGVIGTAGPSKFSVTGDPINVASRIEGSTRAFKVDLRLSDAIRRALDDRFLLHAMPQVLVKGKTDPIQTWQVEAPRARSS